MASFRHRLAKAVHRRNHRLIEVSRATRRRFSRRGHSVVVCAQPKSGSTFLTAALARATGFVHHNLAFDHVSEQDLYLPALLDGWSMDTVSHQHTAPSRTNLMLMAEFGIRPIVLVRDVRDLLISMVEKLDTDPWLTARAAANADFLALPEPERIDRLIALEGPRMIAFHALWEDAARMGLIERLRVSYDEMTADKPGTVARCLEFCGVRRDRARCDAAVAAVESGTNTRFNKGVAGRGRDRLSPAQVATLEALTAPWDWIDFTPIGLGPAKTARPLTRPQTDAPV